MHRPGLEQCVGERGRSPCHDGKVATPSTTRVVLLKLQEGNKEPNDNDSV